MCLDVLGFSESLFQSSTLLDNKAKWIDPKIIEIDNSESDNDFDFIPPSPTPEEILYFSQTRLVFFIHFVANSLCRFELKQHNVTC